jgi:D-sedoheptulose 7-phosphate isomerase
VTDLLGTHLDALTAASQELRAAAGQLAAWGTELAVTLSRGGRLLAAGNGGSAAEAQHLTAELVGKLDAEREPLSALALTADSSTLTALGNDYGFAEVFARQVRAHGRPGDILMLFTTSGRSANLLAGVDAAARAGVRTWALTGPTPNPLADRVDRVLAVPSPHSQVVQELQLTAIHVLCGYVDAALGVTGALAGARS